MTEAASRELLLVGLQETGKTSFLGLFYLALLNGDGQLKLASYQDDREHLNKISKRLMECDVPHHTEVAEEGRLALSLEVQTSGEAVELSVPDLSGETWGEAVEERLWHENIEEQVRNSDGILLFTAADGLDAGVTKGDADHLAASLGAESTQSQPEPVDPRAKQVKMKGKPPTQVQLVDLLQLTAEQRGRHPSRVCIIISAWDTQSEALTPGDYVVKNMPLLSQYLDANSRWLSARIFGVSAQGGSFSDDAEREALARQDPLDRAYALAEDGSKVPIDAPIAWTLAIDDAS
jgi:double-GTPase-like protein